MNMIINLIKKYFKKEKKICICGGGANGILAALFFEKKL